MRGTVFRLLGHDTPQKTEGIQLSSDEPLENWHPVRVAFRHTRKITITYHLRGELQETLVRFRLCGGVEIPLSVAENGIYVGLVLHG